MRANENQGSVGGYITKGRFRIRNVSFTEDHSRSATSVSSTRSAPTFPDLVLQEFSATAATAWVGSTALDQPSDDASVASCSAAASDASGNVAVSVVSENDTTGRLVNENLGKEPLQKRQCAKPAHHGHIDDGDGGGKRGRNDNSHSMGESPTSGTSAGDESEGHGTFLVSCTLMVRASQSSKTLLLSMLT